MTLKVSYDELDAVAGRVREVRGELTKPDTPAVDSGNASVNAAYQELTGALSSEVTSFMNELENLATGIVEAKKNYENLDAEAGAGVQQTGERIANVPDHPSTEGPR